MGKVKQHYEDVFAKAGIKITEALGACEDIRTFAGGSRELSLVVTKLDEAMMWLERDEDNRELDRLTEC